MQKKIAVVNGPNLNWLGRREPETYGATTLDELEARLRQEGAALGAAVTCYQYSSEGALIDCMYALRQDGCDGVILNAGAYTHTSVALRDAMLATQLPFIEVHISNVHRREPFRHHSYLSDIASGIIVGLGVDGYSLALRALTGQAGVR